MLNFWIQNFVYFDFPNEFGKMYLAFVLWHLIIQFLLNMLNMINLFQAMFAHELSVVKWPGNENICPIKRLKSVMTDCLYQKAVVGSFNSNQVMTNTCFHLRWRVKISLIKPRNSHFYGGHLQKTVICGTSHVSQKCLWPNQLEVESAGIIA